MDCENLDLIRVLLFNVDVGVINFVNNRIIKFLVNFLRNIVYFDIFENSFEYIGKMDLVNYLKLWNLIVFKNFFYLIELGFFVNLSSLVNFDLLKNEELIIKVFGNVFYDFRFFFFFCILNLEKL